MGPFTIYNDTARGATLVSNRFIDEYMVNANDAQIKVYLYLIRLIGANMSVSVEDIADKFNHTEKDIIRAFKYWEKQNLLSIDYDEAGDIAGVHMQDFGQACMGNTHPSEPTEEKDIITPLVNTQQDQSTEPVHVNNITKDTLTTLNQDENFQNILFIAEQYIGKMLTATQIKCFAYMYDTLHMSFDLIDFLIEYCVERGKTSHSYMEKIANNWADEGITTVEEAKKTISAFDADIYKVAKALGNYNAPTKAEAALIHKWLHSFGFTMDIISEACNRTVLATNTGRIRYADKILTDWHSADVKHLSDIEALDAAFASKTKKSKSNAVSDKPKNTGFQNQRSYDYASLEKRLLNN